MKGKAVDNLVPDAIVNTAGWLVDKFVAFFNAVGWDKPEDGEPEG